LGTQTIGSVIRPAAFCGIVGYKPTLDRIPSAGLVYFSPTIDHVGLFTQDMASMKLAAGALLRDWRADSPVSRRPILGVPAGPYMAQAERDAILAFEEHLRRLEWEGYHIERVPTLFEVQKLNLLHRRMVFAEFAQQHAHMYEQHADKYRPRTRQIIETGKTVSGEEAAAARANCLALRHELHARMADYDVDLWVTPAAVGAAPYGIQATGDPNMNLPWTHAGMPALTLPAGHDENDLPFGLQFVAHFGADEELMAWAGEIEAALQRTA
jgi:Asp-tRNA(Asn)/Glu-tRNA(Gln) amidotransferase A subunit family amidase